MLFFFFFTFFKHHPLVALNDVNVFVLYLNLANMYSAAICIPLLELSY